MKYLILLISFYGCNFVGVMTIKSYRISRNSEITERGLIDVQYKHPEIRVPENDQNLFIELNHTVPMPNIKLTEKQASSFNTDTINLYKTKKNKDFYYHWNGDKIFLYSSKNGCRYFYEVRVLDSQRKRCEIGILRIAIKQSYGLKWFTKDNSSPSAVLDSAVKSFESNILPKIKRELSDGVSEVK